MQVSSESLFHFTNRLKNLENILSQKFKATYCKETWILNGETDGSIFPMICFCDLPLSMIKNHVTKYGSYAIGMKKSWGIQKKLNPVIYIENNSIIAKDLDNALQHLLELHRKLNKEYKEKDITRIKYIETIYENFQIITDYNLNVFRYLKNYQGDLVRQNKVIKNYRFYDEREWRFVPEFADKDVESSLSEKKYKTYRNKSKEKPLLDKITLEFTASDIEYLIVKSNKDIPQLIRTIQGTNNLARNGDELLELTTRIITIEQLNRDF